MAINRVIFPDSIVDVVLIGSVKSIEGGGISRHDQGIEAEECCCQKTLFRFVKQMASLTHKLTDAALIQLSHPAGNGFDGWKHAVLLYPRKHMDAEYEEVIDWVEEMERIRFLLGLRCGKSPRLRHSARCSSERR